MASNLKYVDLAQRKLLQNVQEFKLIETSYTQAFPHLKTFTKENF